jgi:hypothetical protein
MTGRAPTEQREYHFPFAKPPKATRPMSRMIRPIQKLQMIISTMPMITRMPPMPIPPTLPPLRGPAVMRAPWV